MEMRALKDGRGRKIIFLSPCGLIRNEQVLGLAFAPCAARPLMARWLDQGVGKVRMPCPKVALKGALRWGMVKIQADMPYFRARCQKVVDEVIHQAQDCRSGRYSGLGFFLMVGAPICGFDTIPVSADAE